MVKRQKLWCVIDRIEDSRDVKTGVGKKYLVDLVNGTKPVWVLSKDLSPGVAKSYDDSNATPKKAKAHVNRGFVRKRELFAKKGEPEDPVKLERRHAKWIVAADQWVRKINKVRRGVMFGANNLFDAVMFVTNILSCSSPCRCCRLRLRSGVKPLPS